MQQNGNTGLVSRNGETVSIESMIELLKQDPTNQEIVASLERLRKRNIDKALDHTLRVAEIDVAERVDTFLNGYTSDNTRNAYKKALDHFFAYLEKKTLHPLQITAYEADQYLQFLNGSALSVSTKRLYIAGMSSFYSHLERWNDIEKNPFRGAKRPKKEVPKKAVPSDKDLEAIRRSLERDVYAQGRGAHNTIKRAKMLLPIMHVLSAYGLRVGALPTLYVDSAGTYTGKSKGKKVRGTFTQGALQLLKSYGRGGSRPFVDLTESRVRVALYEETKRLHAQGLIAAEYSPHSFRNHNFSTIRTF